MSDGYKRNTTANSIVFVGYVLFFTSLYGFSLLSFRDYFFNHDLLIGIKRSDKAVIGFVTALFTVSLHGLIIWFSTARDDSWAEFKRLHIALLTVLLGGLAVTLLVIASIHLYEEATPPSDKRIARAERQFQQEKAELEEAHHQEIKEAQIQIKLAEIEAKRLALYNDSAKNGEHAQELEKAKAKLKTIKSQGVDYSSLSKGKEVPSEPVDEQTKLILSGLWLGACFFLQRVFEKVFKDKGYALLTVCAAGFLLAFFTANYFLVAASGTGGIMGSVGDRG